MNRADPFFGAENRCGCNGLSVKQNEKYIFGAVALLFNHSAGKGFLALVLTDYSVAAYFIPCGDIAAAPVKSSERKIAEALRIFRRGYFMIHFKVFHVSICLRNSVIHLILSCFQLFGNEK